MQNQAEMAHPYKSSVPSNYAVLLVGMFIFPMILVGLVKAKKQRTSAQEWEKSHYELQYRSSVAFMLGILAMLLAATTIFFQARGMSPLQLAHTRMWIVQIANLSYLLFGWVAVRSIRGLFLAGGKRAIGNPRSYWVWPSAA
jgi:uncharacterized membrane protein